MPPHRVRAFMRVRSSAALTNESLGNKRKARTRAQMVHCSERDNAVVFALRTLLKKSV